MPSSEEKAYYATKTLEEIQKQVKDLYEIHHACSKNVGVDIAKLQIKSGLWGAAAGLVPSIGVALFFLLKG